MIVYIFRKDSLALESIVCVVHFAVAYSNVQVPVSTLDEDIF